MIFITIDNIHLNYSDQGHGFPVIIMTGYAGYKEIWRSQVDYLINHGYRVINLDRRNSGNSETTTKGLRMSRQGQDLAELIAYLVFTRVNLMGNSMGAAVIWTYLSLYGEAKVNKIISVDQSPKMVTDDTWPYGLLDVTWDNFPKESEKMYSVKTTYNRISNETYAAVKAAQGNAEFNHGLNRPLLYDHVFQDWRDILTILRKPILFVAGRQSPFWSSNYALASATLCDKGYAKIVNNAGHVVMAEQEKEFNQLMQEFLLD
ncbi:alpha/beta hydrolase [Oenococcus sp. UCMA 16435]|nr:alpha/beta hydrolase [Oenococcus sp. UCMA 16435]